MLPIKYKWARQHYKNGVANNWTPEEIPMQKDVEQWKANDVLTENERHLIMWNLGFFSTAESLTANNIVLAMYRHVTNPECRQYMLRQAYEEAVHTDTFLYCCDSLSLDPDVVFDAYEKIPSIKAKDEFVVNLTKTILDPTFEINTTEDKQAFLLDVIGFNMIMEGIFFYAGFAMMLQLMRNNKMKGIGEQFQYILRDESIHISY
jgi:ribonucleoside-diphosphate reductase beta chain